MSDKTTLAQLRAQAVADEIIAALERRFSAIEERMTEIERRLRLVETPQ